MVVIVLATPVDWCDKGFRIELDLLATGMPAAVHAVLFYHMHILL